METRANYVLIGAFTLLGILGTLGFFIWLASVRLDRQYDVYGILFEDVSGLDASGDVLFNGIPVGRVIGLQIYDPDPGRVLATIEIDAATPVRENTVAQVMLQGVTGVAYIALSGGRGDAPALTAPDGELPMIPSRRSTVQGLVEDAPDLLAQANELLGQLQALVGPENRERVAGILRNVESSSGNLDAALTEFSDAARTVREASGQIAGFTARLDTLGAAASNTLANADTALRSATGAFDQGKGVLEAAAPVLASAGTAFESAAALMRDRVPAIVDQISQTATALDAAVRDIAAGSTATLDGFRETASLMNARLAELERTVGAADAAFAAVTEASGSLTTLTRGEATLLVADARGAVAAFTTALESELPAVLAEIRAAVTAGSAAIDAIAADLTGFTEGLGPLTTDAKAALASATQVFDRAATTLDALERSLAVADGALAEARTAFASATGLMDTDLAPVLGDIRSASASIEAAATQLSTDLPAITDDLQGLIARADAVVTDVQSAVAAAGPGISDFASRGLPELGRLGAEARGLVRSLNDVVRSLQRDPARFILQDRVPEYRR